MSDTDCSPKALLDNISCLLAEIDEYVESLEQRWRGSVLSKVKDSVDDLLALVDQLLDVSEEDTPQQSQLVEDEALDSPPTPHPGVLRRTGGSC